jgi:hypothetical protein
VGSQAPTCAAGVPDSFVQRAPGTARAIRARVRAENRRCLLRAHPHRGDTGAEAHTRRHLRSQRHRERAKIWASRWHRAFWLALTPQWA